MWDFISAIGFLIFILGSIALLVEAFRNHVLWGLSCLIFSPLLLIFIVMHWYDGKYPFFVQLFGIFLFLMSAYIPYWSRA